MPRPGRGTYQTFAGFPKEARGLDHRADSCREPVGFGAIELLVSMLGTADFIAQMSDRCYLEKCRDRLYPEIVAGGLADSNMQRAVNSALFCSLADLVSKAPDPYRLASTRLNDVLGGTHIYAQNDFGGQNLYLQEIYKNVSYAESVVQRQDLSLLRRTVPSCVYGGGDDVTWY